MNYKTGDEVLVKARIIRSYGKGKYITEINEDGYYKTFDCKENDIFPYPSMTAEEAWEIAKKILLYPAHGGFNSTELEEIFGRTEHLWELTPQEAKEKIKVWKAGKEIKIGDEVVPKRSPNSDACKFFVTKIDDDMIEGFSGYNGDVFSGRNIAIYQKTGRRIDIEGLLNQIGGNK